jgi:hypothetical protein
MVAGWVGRRSYLNHLVPYILYWTQYCFIVATEYWTKLVKKRLSRNMRASMLLAHLLSVLSVHDTLTTTTMNPSYHFFTSTMWPCLFTTCLDSITRVGCGLAMKWWLSVWWKQKLSKENHATRHPEKKSMDCCLVPMPGVKVGDCYFQRKNPWGIGWNKGRMKKLWLCPRRMGVNCGSNCRKKWT